MKPEIANPLCSDSYALGDVIVVITCLAAEQAAKVRQLWQRLFALRQLESVSPIGPAITLAFTTSEQPVSPEVAAPVKAQPSEVTMLKTKHGFAVQCGPSNLTVDVSRCHGAGVLDETFWQQPLSNQRGFFLLPLVALLRKYGWYGLHAGAVVRDGVGFLLVADSGSGKTTLSLALMHEGWRYLSDDELILGQTPNAIMARPLRRFFSVTPETLTRFPELDTETDYVSGLPDGKRMILAESIFPEQFSPGCDPGVLLFPRITAARRSQLRPLDATQAMTRLIQQSAFTNFDRHQMAQHIEILKKLTAQTRSYQLLAGGDAIEEPAALSDLLSSLVKERA